MYKHLLISLAVITIVMVMAGVAHAFTGPSCSAGSDCALFSVDANKNIGFGTKSPTPFSTYDTANASSSLSHGYIFTVASTTNPGISIKNTSTGMTYIWSSKNDGTFQLYRESVGLYGKAIITISQYGDVGIVGSASNYFYPTARLDVAGNIKSSGGSFIGSGANLTSIDPLKFVAGSAFAVGNYAINGSFAIGTTTTTGLPANGLFVLGNVGIGKTTPAAPLHLYTAMDISANPNSKGLLLESNISGNQKWLLSLGVASVSNHLFAIKDVTAGIYPLVIKNITGNVGIGTASPTHTLTVLGSNESSIKLTTYDAGIGDNWNVLLSNGTVDGYSGIKIGDELKGFLGRDLILLSGRGEEDEMEGGNIYLKTAVGNTSFRGGHILLMTATGGNVGIGTMSPKGKLDVSGGISAGSYGGINTPPSNGMIISGHVGIATTTPATPLSVVGTSTITAGNLKLATTGYGISFPDNTFQTTAFGGGTQTINASYVSAGVFGSASTKGNYTFQASGNTNPVLFVDAANERVGVGTASPTDKLDVAGAIKLTSNVAWDYDLLGRMYKGATGGLTFVGVAGSSYDFTIANPVGTALIANPTGTNNLVIVPSTGNVGIGTTNPGKTLDVNGDVRITTSGRYWFDNGTNPWRIGQSSDKLYISKDNVVDAIVIDSTGNVGIGTTSPTHTLTVLGSSAPSIKLTAYDDISGNNYNVLLSSATIDGYSGIQIGDAYKGWLGRDLILLSGEGDEDEITGGNIYLKTARGLGVRGGHIILMTATGGNVGIGTTNPLSLLHLKSAASAHDNLRIDNTTAGYNSTVDFYEAGSGKWSVGINRNTTAGSFDFYDLVNSKAIMTILPNSGNVGIGTSTPTTAKLVIVPGAQPAIDVGSQKIVRLGYPAISTDAASVQYVSDAITNAVGGATTSTGAYVLKSGDTMSGNLNMGGNNISGVGKLYVTTIDPLYRIDGKNYATYVASIVGGVKEEFVGKAKLSRTDLHGLENGFTRMEYAIDFNKVERGSDLWVWRHAVDFSSDNVEVFATPIGVPVPIAYEIEGSKIIFRTQLPNYQITKLLPSVEFSYRLIGKRFDWMDNPTYVENQNEKPSFVCETGGVCKVNTR